jgi:hypothetical protein
VLDRKWRVLDRKFGPKTGLWRVLDRKNTPLRMCLIVNGMLGGRPIPV